MAMLAVAALLVNSVSSACVVDANGFHFDFSTLDGKQLQLKTQDWRFEFTFCQPSPQLCGTQISSFCQYDSQDAQNSIGLWSTANNWTGAINNLSGDIYGDSTWCPSPRETHVTFKCVDGPANLVSIEETAACKYEATVEVPLTVCSNVGPCCTASTYAATRIENAGTVSVVQVDSVAGNWYDSNFNGIESGILCSRPYNRCFTFTDTTCVSAPYQPVLSQCFGTTSEWTLIKSGNLVQGLDTTQTAWFSKAAGAYVVTMPFGPIGSCVVVSGNKIGSSFDFGLTPNSTLWNVPPSCIKF